MLRLHSDLVFALIVGCLYIGILLLRSPDILIRGRYFAEEGSYWWNHSLSNDWVSELFFVGPLTGYLLLNANLQIVVAGHLPIQLGPLWTAWSSVGLAALPALFVWFARPDWMQRRWAAIGSVGLLLAPPVVTSEAFGNSINSQVYLGLAAIVILVFGINCKSTPIILLVISIVTLGALSGWYTAVLAPLFILRALIRHRTHVDIALAVATTFGLVVQVGVFLHMRSQDLLWPGKVSALPPGDRVPQFAANSLALDLFGEGAVNPVGWPSTWIMVPILLVAILVGFAAIGNFRSCHLARIVPATDLALAASRRCLAIMMGVAAFFTELVLVVFGQAESYFGGRYMVVPAGSLFILIVIILSGISVRSTFKTGIWTAVLVWLVLTSVHNLTNTSRELLECVTPCIVWQTQVQEVQSNQRTVMGHWPMTSDPGDWITDTLNPEVTLAPFQQVVVDTARKNLRP